MVLSAILAGVVVEIIAGPIRAYFWYTQRNQYVDMAQMSLESIQTDLQNSLSSSVSLDIQEQGQSLHFRNILYKGIAIPSNHSATSILNIGAIPENFMSTLQGRELFVVFPEINTVKTKFYNFSIPDKDKGDVITLSEPVVVQHPMPFFIVSGLSTYECSPDSHTLERAMPSTLNQSQKSLLSNKVSDCQFTVIDGQPKRVLVSLSFGERKTRVTLTQPITIGGQ